MVLIRAEHGAGQDLEGAHPRVGHRGEGAGQLVGVADLEDLDADPQGAGLALHRLQGGGVADRLPEHRDTGKRREGLLHQLEPLRAQLGVERREPGHVSAGPREGGDESLVHRIADVAHHDGNGPRGVAGRAHALGSGGDDDRDVQLHHLGREGLELVEVLGRPIDVGDAAALDVAELLQPVPDGLEERVVRPDEGREHPHAGHRLARLSAARRGKRQQEHGGDQDRGSPNPAEHVHLLLVDDHHEPRYKRHESPAGPREHAGAPGERQAPHEPRARGTDAS